MRIELTSHREAENVDFRPAEMLFVSSSKRRSEGGGAEREDKKEKGTTKTVRKADQGKPHMQEGVGSLTLTRAITS